MVYDADMALLLVPSAALYQSKTMNRHAFHLGCDVAFEVIFATCILISIHNNKVLSPLRRTNDESVEPVTNEARDNRELAFLTCDFLRHFEIIADVVNDAEAFLLIIIDHEIIISACFR